MRIFLFFFFWFSFFTANTQNCFPERRKDKQLVQKIEKQIQKRAFYDALELLRKTNDYVIFLALK